MKATKIRVYLIATALAALVVPAVVAVLGVDSHIVFADTVTPGNTSFTASLSSGTNVTIALRNGTTTVATVTCTGSSTGGTTPGSSSAPGTPVCYSVNAPTLSGCTVKAGGLTFNATCTAAGSWNLCVTPTTAQLTGGTVTCTATVLGQHCTAASGAVNFNGWWTNGSPSTVAFSNQSVAVTTSGGFPCPSGNNAQFSASYSPPYTVSDP